MAALILWPLAAILTLGWTVPLVGGILRLRRRSWLQRALGVVLIFVSLAWVSVTPAGWYIEPPQQGRHWVSADGHAAVWLTRSWGNRTWIEWQDGFGRPGRKYAGPTHELGMTHAKPKLFIWFPDSDRLFVGPWDRYNRGVILETLMGRHRAPTPAEAAWLLPQVPATDTSARDALEYALTAPPDRDAPSAPQSN